MQCALMRELLAIPALQKRSSLQLQKFNQFQTNLI